MMQAFLWPPNKSDYITYIILLSTFILFGIIITPILIYLKVLIYDLYYYYLVMSYLLALIMSLGYNDFKAWYNTPSIEDRKL